MGEPPEFWVLWPEAATVEEVPSLDAMVEN